MPQEINHVSQRRGMKEISHPILVCLFAKIDNHIAEGPKNEEIVYKNPRNKEA